MKIIEQLVETTADVLEPNVSFANGGYGDNVHHLLLEQFPPLYALISLHLVLPIITGCASSFLHDVLKKRGGAKTHLGVKDGDMTVTKGEKAFVDENVITTDEVVDSVRESDFNDDELSSLTVDNTKVEDAKETLIQFLSTNGWPTKIAEKDAIEIIKRIIDILQKNAKG